MRCNNCGWNNPEGITKCQKCNQVLNEGNADLDWENDLENSSISDDGSFIICEKCGYQLAGDVSVCPECGHQRDTKKTEKIKREHAARETVADISAMLEEKANPKATRFDATSPEKKRNPRATVADTNESEAAPQAEAAEDKTEEKSYSYKFLAIDRPVVDTKSHGVSPLAVIEMKSSMEIDLKLNDIVLIGGLRFARVE